jgi:hypothetical protein
MRSATIILMRDPYSLLQDVGPDCAKRKLLLLPLAVICVEFFNNGMAEFIQQAGVKGFFW